MTTADNHSPMSTTSSSASVTWDDHYDNPKAEIILTSKNKIGFRVDAWQLKKQSAFFRDLLNLPVQQSFEFAPIHVEVDHDGEAVRMFLDLVVVDEKIIYDIPRAIVIKIFAICDEFQMEEMQVALIRCMNLRLQSPQEMPGSDPWRIFKFAANRNDIELARTCIHAFQAGGITHQNIYRAQSSHFNGIPGNFVAALLLAGYHHNDHDIDDDRLLWERSWHHVATSFNPL